MALRWLLFIFPLLFLQSCEDGILRHSKSEGKILYEISFDDQDIDPLIQNILPHEAELFFSKEKSLLIFSSKGDLFRFSMIANHEKKLVVQQLKIMRKKVKAVFNDRDLFYYQSNKGYTIVNTENIDTIAGLPGLISLIIFDDINDSEFEVVHTDKIEIDHPNWYNLYKDIPEVLLQYEYVLFGIKIKLKAKNVDYFEVDPKVFEADLDYRDISPENLMLELKKLSESM